MSIESTYRNVLAREYILNKLRSGVPISATDIVEEIEDLVAGKDLSIPQFVASGYHVADEESASANKYNNTFTEIHQDLHVLYQEMLRLAQRGIASVERWSVESASLERRLISLEDRVTDLLLLAQDTEGYHSVVIDDFVNLSQVDQSLTTAHVDIEAGEVTMGNNNDPGVATQIFLNSLSSSKVKFTVRNVVGFVSQTTPAGSSDLLSPFKQESVSWWSTIVMNKILPVTCELQVELADEPIEVSKIFLQTHDSVQSGPFTITPMYSTDGVSYYQLPTVTFTQEIRDKATFAFPETKMRWVKFIMTKQGPDPITSAGFIAQNREYQFGFKKIAFYKEGFDPSVGQLLVSKPLWVLGQDGNALEFSKMTLETCERIESGTSIAFDVTVSNDPTVPVDSTTSWTRISPLQRAVKNHPVILDVGDISEETIGDTETVKVSYSAFAGSGVNPATTFHLLSTISGVVVDDTVSGLSTRYRFINPDDRILNYQVKDSTYSGSGNDKLSMDLASLLVFRNVGDVGITPGDVNEQVRAIQRGWEFLDPYYSCVVEIQNPAGFNLGDVGPNEIIIDDVGYTGTVDGNIMTGKTSTQTGIHRIKVHKNNWKEVTPGATDEADLKTKDPLYPFNHKLLIEGYQYDSAFADDKVYNGVDLFAGILMQQVGTFDFLYNAAQDDFRLYALDRDAAGTHTGGNQSTRVFLVKVNEENPDFQNERYVIRFKLLNDLRRYFRLRATFGTEDSTVAPSLDSYKVKLG